MDRYDQQKESRRQLRLPNIDQQPEQHHTAQCDQPALEDDVARTPPEQLHENVVLLTSDEDASTTAEIPSTRGTANVRSRVRYWLNDIVDEMRKKSPASVQKWVDSIQMPNSATGGSTADNTTGAPIGVPRQDDPNGNISNVSDVHQLVDVDVASATVDHRKAEDNTNNPPGSLRASPEEDRQWIESVDHVRQEHHGGLDEQEDDIEDGGSIEHVLIDRNIESIAVSPVETRDALGGCGATSTPTLARLDDGTKQSTENSAGLSLRSLLSKKSLLGKFNRSGSNLDHSPTATSEHASPIGSSGSMEKEDGIARKGLPHDAQAAPSAPSPSPFVVGKSKINEFYDKLGMNKAKYSLIKAKKLDIRNMLGGVGLSGRESKLAEAHSNAPRAEESNNDYSTEPEDVEPAVNDTFADTLDRSDERSSASQHPEPLEVSVIDMDPSDAYEFSFDESFPKSDELIPGMISEEDEEKENILDTTGASGTVGHGHGYGYDAYLNPPKPRTHRIGIGRIGRSSSENPRATARRYNLMEIGRSFSEMNDDDDSFAISECNNSCPNPSSLNTSSSINEHGSVGNLTRSVPVSPIPRASSKVSIHQEQHGQHSTPPHLQQQHSLVEQSSHSRRRSTMLAKDSSLQSDSSRCSSVESLLNARKPDPEKILLNLGFGPAPHSTDVLAKIPKRFLKPSQVRGVDTEAFLRQQQLSMHIHENSVLGYRGLVGNPHIPPSMIVAKIMERFQENDSKTRLTASGLPLPQTDSRNSSGPPSPVPMTRHASLATTDGRLKF